MTSTSLVHTRCMAGDVACVSCAVVWPYTGELDLDNQQLTNLMYNQLYIALHQCASFTLTNLAESDITHTTWYAGHH